MTQALIDLGDYLSSALPEEVEGVEVAYGELMVRVRRDAIVKTLTFLRDDQNCQFKQLIDLTGVDFPQREKRFDVVYNLLSPHQTAVFRNGVVLAAGAGDSVRAVARGRVRFAGWFRGYGKIVILDHGDGYFTVSGHLADIYVEVGDAMQRDEKHIREEQEHRERPGRL